MDSHYEQAKARIDKMNFSKKDMVIIFADWSKNEEHYQWLLIATSEEIHEWIKVVK